MYDGITGIFMEPYRRGRRDKVAGAISGFGIGALSCIAKVTSGRLCPVNKNTIQNAKEKLTSLMKESPG